MERRLGLRGCFLPPSEEPLPRAHPSDAVRAASASAPGRSCHGPPMRHGAPTGSAAHVSDCYSGRQAPRCTHALPTRRSRGPGSVRGRYGIATAPNAQSRSRYMASIAEWDSGSRLSVICAHVSTTPPSHRNRASAAGSIHSSMMASHHPPTAPILYPRRGSTIPLVELDGAVRVASARLEVGHEALLGEPESRPLAVAGRCLFCHRDSKWVKIEPR